MVYKWSVAASTFSAENFETIKKKPRRCAPKTSFVHVIDGEITQNGKFHSRFFGKARKVQRPG